jgi:hypothetical protein
MLDLRPANRMGADDERESKEGGMNERVMVMNEGVAPSARRIKSRRRGKKSQIRESVA